MSFVHDSSNSLANVSKALDLLQGETTVAGVRKLAQGCGAVEILLEHFSDVLLDRQAEVLVRSLGVKDSAESLTRIGADLGVTRVRAGSIAKQGLERLVHAAAQHLGLEGDASTASTLAVTTNEMGSVERAFDWSKLSDEERRLRAVKLASERDFEGLWSLTAAHLILFGDKGAKVSPRTSKSYRQGLKDLLRDWGGVNLIRPNTNAGVEWIRTLETQPMLSKRTGEPLRDKRTGELRVYAPATVALKLAGARAFYRALRWSGATKATPFVDVKPAKDSVHAWDKREAYTSEEINRLVEIAEGPDLVLVFLGAHAGLRISEATNLRWADVMLESRTLRVVRGKGGKTATAVMSGRLQQALAALERGEPKDFVLPYRTYRARERFYALCQRAGVRYEGREFHGTRHHAGVQAYKQFGTFDRVAEHLRQADVNQGKRYGYMADETLKDGVKDW